MTSLADRFIAYHQRNPQIWQAFKSVTIRAISKGKKNLSSDFIFNVIRWETDAEGDDGFKINNDYSACYARLFMKQFPLMAGFFKLRESQVDDLFDMYWPKIKESFPVEQQLDLYKVGQVPYRPNTWAALGHISEKLGPKIGNRPIIFEYQRSDSGENCFMARAYHGKNEFISVRIPGEPTKERLKDAADMIIIKLIDAAIELNTLKTPENQY